MKKIILFAMSIIFVVACKQIPKKESKINHCYNIIKNVEFDSLPLFLFYSDYGDFVDISFDLEKNKLKGSVKEINTLYFEKSTKFDEENLILTNETNNQYNQYNQLLLTHSKSKGEEHISYENKYNDDHKIISRGFFDQSYKTLESYLYSESGLLVIKKTKHEFDTKNLEDREMKNLSWDDKISFYYANNNQKIKEVNNSLNLNDSSVVKYKYDDNYVKIPYQIIKYTKDGNKSSISNLIYDSILNNLVITTWSVMGNNFMESENFKSENLKNEIVIFFDDNCKVSKVTKVETWAKGMKKYSKVEYNNQGDLNNWITFVYPKSSETDSDLTYLKEFDYKYQTDSEGKYYEYTYDKIGNWIERKENKEVVKREIVYK